MATTTFALLAILQVGQLFVVGGGAVSVKLYLIDSTCGPDNVAWVCRNLAAGACCKDPKIKHGNAVESANFDHLPENAIGSIYKATNTHPCGGTKCNSGPGFNLCLSCTGGEEVPFAGAKWQKPNSDLGVEDLTEDEMDLTAAVVDPDVIEGQGRRFRVNYDVPLNITEEIYDLMVNHILPRDAEVPEHLKEYEIVE